MPTTERLPWDCPECGCGGGPPGGCTEAATLYYSGTPGYSGSVDAVYEQPPDQKPDWDWGYGLMCGGGGIYISIHVQCRFGVVTATSYATYSFPDDRCNVEGGPYGPIDGIVTIVSSNPILITIEYPDCLDVCTGTITVTE